MQTKTRKNNFNNIPNSKVLPGGCSCSSSCCCCCCLHGIGFGIGATTAIVKKSKLTSGKKFLLGLVTFVIAGAIGLFADFLILAGLFGELAIKNESLGITLYSIIAIILSILLYNYLKKDFNLNAKPN